MQIRDCWRNVCIPVPSELTPVIMDIYEFALARSDVCSHQWDTTTENYFACRIWKQIQVEKYHQRVSQQQVPGGTDTRLPPAFWKCYIYALLILFTATAAMLHCARGMIAVDLLNPHSRGVPHIQMKCYVSYTSSIKILSGWSIVRGTTPGAPRRISIGRPVDIESNSFLWVASLYSASLWPTIITNAFTLSKYKLCRECELPGWRTCSNSTCWSDQICPECMSFSDARAAIGHSASATISTNGGSVAA
ncbi:uncharacterized protein EDB93DRAFT_251596 [Suillus bovinus]|uniref:uncharacterized protein n=1 Tax=Suillus bovinus TaxID=48563 RepID=UPI001B85C58B|nr:uncharacterized protein EDB93DRAFT_251596 [Suillus bovinus]KAG2152559.1 hypothetical protein EDB93DRAFT_251596 [Suillus bovinus]